MADHDFPKFLHIVMTFQRVMRIGRTKPLKRFCRLEINATSQQSTHFADCGEAQIKLRRNLVTRSVRLGLHFFSAAVLVWRWMSAVASRRNIFAWIHWK